MKMTSTLATKLRHIIKSKKVNEMKVKELKEFLNKYPDDMVVVYSSMSDYQEITGAEVVKAVNKGFYIMRSHQTMSQKNKDNEEEVLELM